MESNKTVMSTLSILPLHIESCKPPLSHAVSEESSNLDSSSVRTERSQEDTDGSDRERPASSITSDSESEANQTISLLPSEPTTPITSLLSLSETPYKLLAANHPTTGRLYKIQALPGKGMGMLATALIPAGTRLLAETPIMTVQRRDWAYETTQRKAILSAYLSLPHPYMQLFDALHHAPSQFQDWHGMIETEYNDAAPFGPDDPPPNVPFNGVLSRMEQSRVMAVFSTNAFGVTSSSRNVAAAICPEASRLNHACTPNMQFTWNDDVLGGAITLHAIRDILAGEEITASYVDLLKSEAERKEKLRDVYGFECACVVCGANDEVIAASNTRRHLIHDGFVKCHTEREDEPWRRELSAPAKELLDLTICLLKEEGLVNMTLSNALEMGIVPGDRVYLQQALTVLERCIGTDHKWFLRMRGMLTELDAVEAFDARADESAERNTTTDDSAANPPKAELSSTDVVAELSAAAASTSSQAVGESVDAVKPAPELALRTTDEAVARTDGAALPTRDESDSDADDIPCFDGACDGAAAVQPGPPAGDAASTPAPSSGFDGDSDAPLRHNLVLEKKEKLDKMDKVAANRLRKRRLQRAERLTSDSDSDSNSNSDLDSDLDSDSELDFDLDRDSRSDIPPGKKLVLAARNERAGEKAREKEKGGDGEAEKRGRGWAHSTSTDADSTAAEKEGEGEGEDELDTLTLTGGRMSR